LNDNLLTKEALSNLKMIFRSFLMVSILSLAIFGQDEIMKRGAETNQVSKTYFLLLKLTEFSVSKSAEGIFS